MASTASPSTRGWSSFPRCLLTRAEGVRDLHLGVSFRVLKLFQRRIVLIPHTLCGKMQMIARIHTKVRPVREMIHTLLVKIGRHHPQVRCTSVCMLTQICRFILAQIC